VITAVPERGNQATIACSPAPSPRPRTRACDVDRVLADRGFGTRGGDEALREHEVKHSVIPRRGRAAPVEETRGWRRRYRFRNGLEGRISQLKRKGLRRTRLRGLPGAQAWVGGIALAHNLQRMALLT
jgi:IS5 family transposase